MSTVRALVCGDFSSLFYPRFSPAAAAVANRPRRAGPSSTRATPTIRDRWTPRSRPTFQPDARSAYLFDGLTRFTPDAQGRARTGDARGTSRPDGLTYTFHLRQRRQVPRRHARSRRRTSSRQLPARARPERPRADAAGRSIRSRAPRTSPTARRRRSPDSPRPTTPRVVDHAQGAVRDLPEAARDAGRLDRPRQSARQFRRESGRHRAVEVRRVEARRLPALRARTRTTGTARRRPTR